MSRKPGAQNPGREMADCVGKPEERNVAEPCRNFELAPNSGRPLERRSVSRSPPTLAAPRGYAICTETCAITVPVLGR
jgi:hypothetical protein